MTHSLTLEIPESIYQPLAEEAKAKGQKIEQIALERLIKTESKPLDDPLDKFVGAFNSDVPDWVENHDKYLSQQFAEELQTKE